MKRESTSFPQFPTFEDMGDQARERLIHCANLRQEAALDKRLCSKCGYVLCICGDDALFNLAVDITRSFVRKDGVL